MKGAKGKVDYAPSKTNTRAAQMKGASAPPESSASSATNDVEGGASMRNRRDNQAAMEVEK